MQKLKVKDLKEVTEEDKDEFSKKWMEEFNKVRECELEEKGRHITKTLYESAIGLVAEEVTLKYPKSFVPQCTEKDGEKS